MITMTQQGDARAAMNKMYRVTRHVYDITRKYYLLGRDKLIEKLNAKPGEQVCCIGCGTGRNLIKMKNAYPAAHFYGIDASDEMLKTARRAIGERDIPLAQGFAENFDPAALFGLQRPVDKFIFSYALSIIPPWRESIDHVLDLLPPGGEIHIVDFGAQEGLPKIFRRLLYWWLGLFHVYYKPEIVKYLHELDAQDKGRLKIENLYKGYAFLAVFTKI